MDFDFLFMLQALKAASGAIPRSLGIAFSAVIIGSALGMPLALARFYKVPFFARLAACIITVMKGIPVILLYFIFYVLLSQTGMTVNVIALIVISFAAMCEMSEVFRGALESIDKSQFDAAASVGHTAVKTFTRIIVPQMIPVALPMTSGAVIHSIKAMPVAVLIGLMDILNTAISEAVINYRYLEAYFAAALIFWGIFIVVERTFIIIEGHYQKKMHRALV